jgi:hypothetical protein
VPVAGSTAGTYVLTPGDLGSTVSVVVTATNAAGSQSATAPTSSPVAAAPVPPAVVGSAAAVAAEAGAVVTTDGSATVTWQPGAVPVGSTVALSNTPTQVSLALTPALKTLPWPVDLAYANGLQGQVVGYSTDGRIWSPVGALAAETLPTGLNAGTFADHIVTRKPGFYRLFVPKAWGDPTRVSRFAPRLRRIAPIRVQRLRSGALVVSTRMTTPSQVLLVPSHRRILAPGSFPVKIRVSKTTRRVRLIGIDPYGRRGTFTLSFRAP